MLTNPVIESMLNRKSVRKYTDQKPTDEVIATVVRAGQQAPFALQMCSKQRAKIKLEIDRKEHFTYKDYSWTEHISRKSGQWWSDPKELLDQMEKCGFVIGTKEGN